MFKNKGITSVFEAKRDEATEEWKRSVREVYIICTQCHILSGTAVAQWLKYCATNRKVAGSIPAGVMIFH